MERQGLCMKKRIRLISFLLVVILAMTSCKIDSEEEGMNSITCKIVDTDKVRYNPGEKAIVTVEIESLIERERDITVVLSANYLSEPVEVEESLKVTVDKPGVQTVTLNWQTPEEDYKGYLLEVRLEDKKGKMLSQDTIGVDVSSSWVKFPRYGYLCDFEEGVDATDKIDRMNRYHINGIEYYDWQYLHHMPVADTVSEDGAGMWQDWAGRSIDGDAILSYIKEAKEKNMVNMAYNMIYAGSDTFFTNRDGKSTKANDWKLYFAEDNDRGSGEFSFHMGTSPNGNGNLFFLNPLNNEWQEYIFEQELKALRTFGFDGWHGDTVGDWGKMTTSEGKPLGFNKAGDPIYLVTDTYTDFLNAAKDALGDYYLSFNPVGAKGIENANVSNSDVLYTEFWPWDKDREDGTYDTYSSLVSEVERTMEDSKNQSFDGKGKSLVVKAYINYEKTNGEMNTPSVLLCDAAVYAAGGSRLELGNGDRMLHKEYYPDDNVLMSEELTDKMKRMSDFVVAYENLLRDGQETVEKTVEVEEHSYSNTGESDTIWVYSRADEKYEIVHFINLLGTDNLWRDEIGKKKTPEKVCNLKVTYYSDSKIKKIFLASPDTEYGASTELKFVSVKDEKGMKYTFEIPSLEYWDMVYMEK